MVEQHQDFQSSSETCKSPSHCIDSAHQEQGGLLNDRAGVAAQMGVLLSEVQCTPRMNSDAVSLNKTLFALDEDEVGEARPSRGLGWIDHCARDEFDDVCM
jgi:hypothetical protein